MKCDFCGNVFDVEQAASGCKGCPMNSACKKIKCPNCNYEMYPKPEYKMFGSAARFMARVRGKGKGCRPHNKVPLPRNGEVSLTSLKTGDKACIIRLDTDDAIKVRKLSAFGILPGMEVQVLRKYPAIVLQAGYTQVAVDDEIASAIMVNA